MDETQLWQSLDPVRPEELKAVVNRPVFDELLAELVAAPVAGRNRRGLPVLGPSPRYFRRRLAVAAATATLAALVLVLALTSPFVGGTKLPQGSYTTPWRPGQPASSPAQPTRLSGPWRLTSYITGAPAWAQAQGPPPGAVACPTASSCYVTVFDPDQGNSLTTRGLLLGGRGGQLVEASSPAGRRSW